MLHAINEMGNDYEFQIEDWQTIDDPFENYKDDWIHPVRVIGRAIGNSEWGKFEKLVNGQWIVLNTYEKKIFFFLSPENSPDESFSFKVYLSLAPRSKKLSDSRNSLSGFRLKLVISSLKVLIPPISEPQITPIRFNFEALNFVICDTPL